MRHRTLVLARLLGLAFVAILGTPSLGVAQTLPLQGVLPAVDDPALASVPGLVRGGRYQEALSLLEDERAGRSSSPGPRALYAHVLSELGRYDEAVEVVTERDGVTPIPGLGFWAGSGLWTRGRLSESEEAFRADVSEAGPTRHLSQLYLAVLLWQQGMRDQALPLFDSFIDLYNGSDGALSASDLMAVGVAVQYLGITNPDLFQDALMAFDDAAEADPNALLPDILAGELFLEKYRATDAREALRPVLEANPTHPRALLAQARILGFEGVGGGVQLVRQALEVNPAYPDAWAFLASHYLALGEPGDARVSAGEALETNPGHLGALSVLAATQYLAGDRVGFESTRTRVFEVNPVCPEFFTVLALHAESQRLYSTAVGFASEAVALDPTSWKGHGLLGINQLRTGGIEEGRQSLELAFEGDPYNPWYLNTLNLLDTFVQYRTIPTENFEILIHADEADLLGPYAGAVAEEAFAALRDRYGSEPPTPIRLEIYPRHADFSVRTLGIPGLGALGVSFGSTVVMDSPSALDVGSFNWLSTLWHEIAHAFHLAISDHRVPRWFSEGLAVHEQRVARARWGFRASPAWLQAYAAGRLHPVSRLDRGFMRPEYPEQVVFSYYQASLVFELIEERWGLPAIVRMMEAYAAGRGNDRVFREVLGESLEDFDETFDAFVQERWGERIAAVTGSTSEGTGLEPLLFEDGVDDLGARVRARPNHFQTRLQYGISLFEAGRLEEAETELLSAFRLFPEYGGMEGPLLYLARVYAQRGNLERAGSFLHQLGGLNEKAFGVYREEAEVWGEAGQGEAQAVALERAVEIHPFDVEMQRELASVYDGLGDWDGAVAARRAILALDPSDRADAHYQLARALTRAGEPAEARTQVLRALEIAPGYEAALELLLELRGGGMVDGLGVER